MKRAEFEHVLRAAADVVGGDVVVIGSQAVLAQYPEAPEALLRSMEVDVYPLDDPERADVIDSAIGDGSQFHATYDYYAHGVGPETAVAPAGWETRSVAVEVRFGVGGGNRATAWCMEIHDLVLAKLAAGRQADIEYAQEAVRARLVEIEQLTLGLDLLPESHREATRDRLAGVLARLGGEQV